MTHSSDVVIRDLGHGLMSDFAETEYPSLVYGFRTTDEPLVIGSAGTLIGFVLTGKAKIRADGREQVVEAKEYFSIPVHDRLDISGPAKGFGVLRLGYIGLRCIGGPIESRGRLKYIDGCSDTLLISPPVRGDPCFNLLHFPRGVEQTRHTHPTIRVGMIHEGAGRCHTDAGTQPLDPGKMFILYPGAAHAFSTAGTDGMSLTVFHPDTDVGPAHDEHPMLNRTIVSGVSARYIDAIRTKEIL
jgi:quercetin dioxygenase-like cupin family protein